MKIKCPRCMEPMKNYRSKDKLYICENEMCELQGDALTLAAVQTLRREE